MNQNKKELTGIFEILSVLANKFKKQVMKIDMYSIICPHCRKRSADDKNAQTCRCGMVPNPFR